MSKNKPHPHEEYIIAYYRGEQVQCEDDESLEWEDMATYDPLTKRAPVFNPKNKYRIKPQTHEVTLTVNEIESIWLLLRYVGGNPRDTPRAHTDSVYEKFGELITEPRMVELVEWRGMEDSTVAGVPGIKFKSPLP